MSYLFVKSNGTANAKRYLYMQN